MSHVCGSVPVVSPAFHIGPDTGQPQTSPNTWAKPFAYSSPPSGTKFIILHFQNVTLPASNRLEVDLGYGTDVFTGAGGGSFWTRPINVAAVGSSVPIRYITNGAGAGGAFVDRYGRGESLPSEETGHNSITNCNPFLIGGWDEPDFPHIPGSTDPKYDPFWICNRAASPKWQNVQCGIAGSVQRRVAQSVGMIVSVHAPTAEHPHESVSTCSVTYIGSDLVVLAAHCIDNPQFDVPTSSVTFDYEVLCDGSLVPAYNAIFYKVVKLVRFRYTQDRDYAVLQLRGSPPVPTITLRSTPLGPQEQVFGIHHPNGAVKKVSPSATGTMPIGAGTENGPLVQVNFDVAGGSSGSGLFDNAGRIVGVLANGPACNLKYSTMRTMLLDIVDIPNPPINRAVMLVMDRSGSMSESTGDGKVKIAEARRAAELFISMVRTIGNRVGLVSFSNDASSPVDFALSAFSSGSKAQLNAKLATIAPAGATSIGDGLASARDQLASATTLPRSILLLTDGMENTPQMISDVGGLGGVEITAIGFGAESNLDGARLTSLAQARGGLYKRADDGLELRKFFALAFGEIFEAGTLADPRMHLGANDRVGPDIPFHVCGEEAITVVIGWDVETTPLLLEVATPTGQILNLSSGGIESDSGSGWLYARIPLPQAGERDGLWKARVFRPGQGEFPPPAVPLNYFVNVIARGGPSLRPFSQPQRIYTGDLLHPKVMLQFADETVPRGGQVSLMIRRPRKSVGTILAKNGLGTATVVKGDVIPARQATLKSIEQKTGAPVTDYVESNYDLTDSGEGAETFKPAGIFGKRLEDILVVEGTYSFHAKARIALGCTATRECHWSYHVGVGIDPASTPVTAQPVGTGPGGGDRVQVTFTPQDRYGNLVGPGAAGDLDIAPLPGCTVIGTLIDLGDGRYVQEVECDPDSDAGPGLIVGQPGRHPVVIAPPTRERTGFRYTVTLACGMSTPECCECTSLAPGRYATAVTVFNPTKKDAILSVRILPTTFAGATVGRWPQTVPARAEDKTVLKPGEATTIDCCSVNILLLGAPASSSLPTTHGLITLESSAKVEVAATYTVASPDGTSPSIDVQTIQPSELRAQEPRGEIRLPATQPLPTRSTPVPRPQDVPRQERENAVDQEQKEGSRLRNRKTSPRAATSK